MDNCKVIAITNQKGGVGKTTTTVNLGVGLNKFYGKKTVVGERDENFNHVSPGSCDAVKSVISSGHPLYSRINTYYDSIVSSVKNHTTMPSFMAGSKGKAQTVELEWDGSKYTATLTDSNNALSKFTFTASVTGMNCTVSGNKLIVTSDTAPSDVVTITATRDQKRSGVIVWTDGQHRSGGVQDTVTYHQTHR